MTYHPSSFQVSEFYLSVTRKYCFPTSFDNTKYYMIYNHCAASEYSSSKRTWARKNWTKVMVMRDMVSSDHASGHAALTSWLMHWSSNFTSNQNFFWLLAWWMILTSDWIKTFSVHTTGNSRWLGCFRHHRRRSRHCQLSNQRNENW